MTDNAFKAKDIGLRAQKKILSRMATKNVAKVFIDGTTASLLDNVYRLVKVHVSIDHVGVLIFLSLILVPVFPPSTYRLAAKRMLSDW